MDTITLQRLAGWFALINTIMGFFSFAALMIFFVVGGFWGPVNDSLSVVWALSLIPLAGWFFLANRPAGPVFSAVTAILGIGSMLIFAALQFLLVIGLVRYEQTLPAILTLTGAIGLWQILNGLMARSVQAIPPGLTWVMLFSGAGLFICAASFWLGGAQHPVTAVGYLAGFVAGFVWTIWLSRLLMAVQTLAFR